MIQEKRKKLNLQIDNLIQLFHENDYSEVLKEVTALLNQNPNFSNVALTGGLAINFNFPLSLNIGYGKSNNNPEENSVPQTIVSVFSSKLGYKFFNNMLATNLGISMVQATQLELLDNQKLSTKFSVQYKLNKNFLIAFNYDRVQVKDQLNRDNDQSLSRGKLNFKYNF